MSKARDRGQQRRREALAARRAAVAAVQSVLDEGRSLAEALPHRLDKLGSSRGLAQELAYGTLRWHSRLAGLVDCLLDKPLKDKDRVVARVLETGLYQLMHTDAPGQWVVSECVDSVRALRRGWASGLVNAALRRFTREGEALQARVDADPATRFAHPRWLVERLSGDWPDDWQTVLAANNTRPPMTLRVNAARQSREAYQRRLGEAGLVATPDPHAPDALTLDNPVPVDALPGFRDGDCSVQDAGAQLAAILLDARHGDRVLDACAAPGGKTGHILERSGQRAEVVAVDSDAHRLEAVRENLARLGGEARLVAADAAEPEQWWDGRPFQRILIDAPCSATGVIRRHPDIKWLRRPADTQTLGQLQSRLLEALWPLLAPGGKLVYATCSVLRCENEAVVGPFTAAADGVEYTTSTVPWGRAQALGWQILPGDNGMDGFFYTCLRKAP